MIHDLLWGNAFAEIQRDNAAAIIGLWPRNPARTRAIRLIKPMLLEGTQYPAGTLMYETTESLMSSDPNVADQKDVSLGARRLILAEDMVHVPGLSLDGRVGQSTVWLARQIIGLALATEKYGAKFFGNGARPAGVLTIPSAMQDTAVENLRRSWAEAHGGENKWKVAVLEQGVKFEKIAATPEEGQMLGTRQYERSEICAVFNVPEHMVASGDKGQGKSTVEQSSIEFVQYCLNPWIVSWQMELTRKLFPKMGRTANKFFPGFDKRHLMYPDADSRAKFYASGRQWGYLTKNDIRELEDLNPDESGAGDIYTVQVNMINDAALIPGGSADGSPKPGVPGNPQGVPAASA
jgi:HK97 family phage portal protein